MFQISTTTKNIIIGYRLYQAHRELKQSNPKLVKVTNVANHCGFWHMAQFAADYRSFFGELPSETLKRILSPHLDFQRIPFYRIPQSVK